MKVSATSVAIVLSCLAALPAYGQTGPGVPPKSAGQAEPDLDLSAVQSRRSALFQRMLERPDDLDAAFEYAALSVRAGDLEAAVTTLERMLIFAPGLPRLQLELGVLYYRLSAFETARSYFEAALSAPDVPEEVRAKVAQYLSGVDQAGETTRFSGHVRAGVRYQTNANRAPADGTVLLGGLPFVLTPESVGDDDYNVFGAGFFHLSHDLPSQGDTLEADLVAYGSRQFEREELDAAVAELTFGPAFDLGRFGVEESVVGVYGIASAAFIGGEFYSAGAGAGLRFVTRPSRRFFSLTALEYRYRNYDSSDVAPAADLRDGGEFRAFSRASYAISPVLALGAGVYLQRSEAKREYLAYVEAGLSASLSISFAGPFGGQGTPWVVTPNGGLVFREYDGPDPIFSPSDAETDREAFVGATLAVPLAQDWSLMAEAEYRDVSSDYEIRDYDNLSVSFSIVKRF